MKTIGFVLLPSGCFLVLTALVLLRTDVARDVFVAAGVGVELMGLVLLTRAHITVKRERD